MDLISNAATRRAAKRTGREVAAALAANTDAAAREDALLRRTLALLDDSLTVGQVPPRSGTDLRNDIYEHLVAKGAGR